MEARLLRSASAVVLLVASLGANHRTDNFTCDAPTREIAVQVCEQAERFRRELALDWIGYELPRWSKPCPITVQVGPRMGAGGATSFVFDRGEVFGWQMSIQGTLERVLDSVLPHEVTHAVFASHFRQPLPRWADEGACTTVEHVSERTKQQKMLIEFLHTGRGISFAQMFAMKEYPADVLPLYAQGHSLASYLIDRGGKRKFMTFLADGMKTEDWPRTIREHYGIANLGALQNQWVDWVAQGSPRTPNANSTEADARPIALASAAVPVPTPNVAAKDDWSATMAAKRSRPQPNLVYSDTPSAAAVAPIAATATVSSSSATPIRVVSAGPLVPITPGATSSADVTTSRSPSSASPIPTPLPPYLQSAAQRDPFAAAPPPASPPNPFAPGNVGRPQTPETPRQTILEWSKQPDPSASAPIFDSAMPSHVIRR